MFWFDKIAIIINSLLEITSVLILVDAFNDGKKRKSAIGLALFYFVMLTYLAWVNFFAVNQKLFAVSYLLLFLFAKWRYRMSILQGILVPIGGVVVVGILEMVFYAPSRMLSTCNVPERVISFIVVLAMMGTIIILVNKVRIASLKKMIFHREKYSFIVVIICSVMVIYAIISFSGSKHLLFSEYVYITSCAVTIVLSFFKLNQYRYETKIRMEYSERYRGVLEQIRERQHKFSNQLNTIYALHEVYDTYDELVDKQKQQTEQLQKYIMPNNVIILRNPIVIAHVYQKICEAADHNILLETNFNCDVEAVSVPDIYLVDVIGTLFDNAMEAICETGNHARMYFGITRTDNEIIFEVANEHEYIPFGEWKKFFGRGYSTKGENRGLGLYHMNKLVKKQGGKVVVENKKKDHSNYFSVRVVFVCESAEK